MESTELEFYCFLQKAIDVDMAKHNLKVDDLKGRRYIISRQTYFNIQNICTGNKKSARLSHTKMLKVCDYLGISIEKIKYVYKKL